MAFTDKAWDGAEARWPDADSYCASCLIDENKPGEAKTKALCKLPVREPSGDYNRNAIRNALARIGQVQASSTAKAAALRKLQALKKQAGIGQP